MIREFVVRTVLMLDFLGAVPIFVLLLWRDPEAYARTLGASEASIRERILKYRREGHDSRNP